MRTENEVRYSPEPGDRKIDGNYVQECHRVDPKRGILVEASGKGLIPLEPFLWYSKEKWAKESKTYLGTATVWLAHAE